jgi:hypothetical protein
MNFIDNLWGEQEFCILRNGYLQILNQIGSIKLNSLYDTKYIIIMKGYWLSVI